MAKYLETYPTILPDAIKKIDPSVELSLKYLKDNEEKNIEIARVPDTLNGYYIDDNGEWNPKDYNITIKGKLTLNQINCLFRENKVAAGNTLLGIGMTYVSKTSKINYTKPLIVFNSSDSGLCVPFEIEIDKGRISQKLDIEFFAYVKEAPNKTLYASLEGETLGTITSITIDLEGSGSIFPIKIIDDPTKPLWTMHLNYDSLEEDFSILTVCLKINKAHKDYKFLGSQDIDSSNYYLWKEILASFFSNILINSAGDYESLYNNQYEDGTVGCFISYLVESFGIDKATIENSIQLTELLRTKLDLVIR